MLLLYMLAFRSVGVLVRSVLLIRVMRFFLVELLVVCLFVVIAGARQRFTGKHFDGGAIRGRRGWRRGMRVLVRLAVIVVLEVFENVADVEESVTIETDVHEGRLHAG